jgi:hypothetical protein
MPRWHTWMCDYNPAEYEQVPKGYTSHQQARGNDGFKNKRSETKSKYT